MFSILPMLWMGAFRVSLSPCFCSYIHEIIIKLDVRSVVSVLLILCDYWVSELRSLRVCDRHFLDSAISLALKIRFYIYFLQIPESLLV